MLLYMAQINHKSLKVENLSPAVTNGQYGGIRKYWCLSASSKMWKAVCKEPNFANNPNEQEK